jgi:nucleoside phosphorylase
MPNAHFHPLLLYAVPDKYLVSYQPSIQAILVCQGAEYQAVCRGLNSITGSIPSVIPTSIGINSITIFLQKSQLLKDIRNHPQPKILVMGLCGSLTPRYSVGDIVLYGDCIYQENTGNSLVQCDRAFTGFLEEHLQGKISLVKALTSDRMIWSATEKRALNQMLAADVVDMEGFAILEFFQQAGVAVAMLRVVSDGCSGDLPNLNSTFSPDGSLLPLSLAAAMLKQPIAATRLIRGALKGLQVLEQVTTFLFQAQV